MQSLTYDLCLDYWNRYKKFYYDSDQFVYGIVATPNGILPYIKRIDRFFSWKLNTYIPQACNVYYLFKSLPSPEEFSINCKNLMLYVKQQSISQDFQ